MNRSTCIGAYMRIMHLFMYMCMCVCVCVNVRTCMTVPVYVMYICVYACLCVCVYKCAWMYNFMKVQGCIMYTYVCIIDIFIRGLSAATVGSTNSGPFVHQLES